ncbi:hypothetical protein ABBQ32_004416 [Trebouxia sp. C0010 RCD-2024]
MSAHRCNEVSAHTQEQAVCAFRKHSLARQAHPMGTVTVPNMSTVNIFSTSHTASSLHSNSKSALSCFLFCCGCNAHCNRVPSYTRYLAMAGKLVTITTTITHMIHKVCTTRQ